MATPGATHGGADIVSCPGCGARNRVPAAARGWPRCPRCKTSLPWLVAAHDDDAGRVLDDAPGLVLVDLWAEWCGPCRQIAPIVERLSAAYAGKLKVVKVDVDRSPNLAARFGVQGIPTLALVSGGRTVDVAVGARGEAALRTWVDEALNAA